MRSSAATYAGRVQPKRPTPGLGAAGGAGAPARSTGTARVIDVVRHGQQGRIVTCRDRHRLSGAAPPERAVSPCGRGGPQSPGGAAAHDAHATGRRARSLRTTRLGFRRSSATAVPLLLCRGGHARRCHRLNLAHRSPTSDAARPAPRRRPTRTPPARFSDDRCATACTRRQPPIAIAASQRPRLLSRRPARVRARRRACLPCAPTVAFVYLGTLCSSLCDARSGITLTYRRAPGPR